MTIPIRSFCITLPELPERTARARQQFREHVADVQFWNGIHAERFGVRTVNPYEVDDPGSGFNIGWGPTGCWLSHYTLWMALTLLWEDCFLIFEDDVKFSPDWRARLAGAMRDVPKDFDVLYLGSCCCEGKPTEWIAGEVYRVEWPMCLHGYVVARKALPKLLATQRKLYAPIDISLIFHSFPEMKVYTVLPSIFGQFDTDLAP